MYSKTPFCVKTCKLLPSHRPRIAAAPVLCVSTGCGGGGHTYYIVMCARPRLNVPARRKHRPRRQGRRRNNARRRAKRRRLDRRARDGGRASRTVGDWSVVVYLRTTAPNSSIITITVIVTLIFFPSPRYFYTFQRFSPSGGCVPSYKI